MQKVPQLIGECKTAGAADTYLALKRLKEASFWGSSPDDTALYRSKPGRAMTTGYFRGLMRKYASLLGFNPRDFGAHSARIGGATDLAATGRASQLLLQAKGRWSSDIAKIYARMTRRSQLAVSDLMYLSKGRDLEEILPEFTQPI